VRYKMNQNVVTGT